MARCRELEQTLDRVRAERDRLRAALGVADGASERGPTERTEGAGDAADEASGLSSSDTPSSDTPLPDTSLPDTGPREGRDADRPGTAEGSVTAARAADTRTAAETAGPETAGPPEPPTTPEEKVALYGSLFAGRRDRHARRWENRRTGRAGYAPACSREWHPDLCAKPRVPCSRCGHRALEPLTDRVVRDHLEGRATIGLYPLLDGDTCRLLVLDLDGTSWQQAAAGLREAARHGGLDPLVEISRSGSGAHIWLLFGEEVPAARARDLGRALLTRAGAACASAFDRMIPGQDVLPAGGFGSLIALPLQGRERRRGRTVFIDDDLRPLTDPWSRLAAATLASRADLEAAIAELTPARHAPEPSWPERLPAQLASGLCVETSGLTPTQRSALISLAEFPNPVFARRSRLRLSTRHTPRVIRCHERDETSVTLPRGLRAEVEAMLAAREAHLEVDDLRTSGRAIAVRFAGTLREDQERALAAFDDAELGVLVASPGTGKTVMGIDLIARRRRSALVLVHRRPLLEQWRAQLATFLDIPTRAVGAIGGGRWQVTGEIDVAMVQSIARRGFPEGVEYGHVVVDECHHVPAYTFERLLRELPCRYATGLTATPVRRDGLHPIVHQQLGPIRYRFPTAPGAAGGGFVQRLIVRETAFQARSDSADSVARLYGELAADEQRNGLIFEDVIAALEEGRSPIVLTERRRHVSLLAERLAPFTRHLVVLQGGGGAGERRRVADRLATIPADEERLLIATGRYIGEGFDDARLDTLFLALPISWRGTLVQYAGRLHRRFGGKREVRIVDYVDRRVPVLARMFERRRRGYASLGYREVGAEGNADEMPGEPRVSMPSTGGEA